MQSFFSFLEKLEANIDSFLQKKPTLSKIYEFLFNAKLAGKSETDVGRFLFYVALSIGFLFGVFVEPIWNEMAEWGQSISGNLAPHPKNMGRASDLTLQTRIPALLFKMGIPSIPIGLLTSGVAAAISFSAISMAAFNFVRVPIFCLLMPFLLLGHPFYGFHFYAVVFPQVYTVFGNFGFFFCMLGFALFGVGNRRIALFIFGALPMVHAPWGVGSLATLTIASILMRKPIINKKELGTYGLGVLTTALVVVMTYMILPEHKMSGNFFKTKKENYASFDIQKVKSEMTELDGTPFSYEKPEGFKVKLEEPISHNQKLTDLPDYWQAFRTFYQSDYWFYAFLLLLFILQRKYFRERLKDFVLLLSSVFLFAVGLKIIESGEQGLKIYAYIHHQLPELVRRTITNRFFNMSIPLGPVVVYSFIAYLALEKRRFYAALFFPVVLLNHQKPFFSHIKEYPIFYTFAYGLIALWILDLLDEKGWLTDIPKKLGGLSRGITSIMVSGYLLFFATTSITKAAKEQKFLFKHEFGPIVEALKDGSENLLFGDNVNSFAHFNAQLQLNRSYFLPNQIFLPLFDEAGTEINVYCQTNQYKTWSENQATFAKCLRERKPEVWRYIAGSLHVSHLLVKSDLEVSLPLTAKAGQLALYALPQPVK